MYKPRVVKKTVRKNASTKLSNPLRAQSTPAPFSLYRRRSYKTAPRRTRTTRYKRHYKRRSNKFSIVNRTKEIIADTWITKLRYQGIKQYSAITTYTEYAIALNNISDAMPNATSTQRPLGWNELNVFYKEYRVYGAKIDIHVANLSDTLICFGVFSTTTTPGVGTGGVPSPLCYTGLQNMEEDREVSHIYLTKDKGRMHFSKYFSVADTWGVSKKTVDNDDTYKADFAGTPSQSCWIRWGIAPVGGVASNVDITFNITYYVKCYEKKEIVPSLMALQQKDDSSDTEDLTLEEITEAQKEISPTCNLTKSDYEFLKQRKRNIKFEDLSKV